MNTRPNNATKILLRIATVVSFLLFISCSSSSSDSGDATSGFNIKGQISGLQGSITLQNNASESITSGSSGSFSFDNQLDDGVSYNVTILTQPIGQTCTVSHGSGTVNAADVSDILVSCISLFNLGGMISGLTGTLRIQNNGIDTLQVSNNGVYVFNQKIVPGDLFNVQISQNPSSQICSIVNASGQVADANISNADILCTADNTTVALSGSYQIAGLTQVDSDINDPFAAANVSNNSFNSAQFINNFSTVHGFATALGTGRVVEGDRFASSADEWDVYRVNLQNNQTLRMQVVNFTAGNVFQGDLDLYLFDINTLDAVASSLSTGEYEEITVPGSAEYYLAVQAFSGSSKYTLSLDSVVSAAQIMQNSMDFTIGEAIIQFKETATNPGLRLNNKIMKFSHQDLKRATLARFKPELTSNSLDTTVATAFEKELAQLNAESMEKLKTLKQIKQLNLRQDVEFAEPNYLYQPLLTPNDEFYGLQWHYPAISLPQAWNITTGDRTGDEVIVAVVDTGVFLAHPEFSGQLVSGYDFISDPDNAADGENAGIVNSDIDANPDDPGDSAQVNNSSWHGSHVAGTIAASSDNTSGVSGIAWGAKIMPIRVLGTQGGTGYDIIQSIRYAAGLSNDSGTLPTQIADIINLSLGGSGFSQAAQDAYDAVRAKGVIVVAAAGNENTSELSYPASYDGVISVSATDFINSRAPYSNFGSRIDVAAPGGNTGVDLNEDGYTDGILSTLVDDSSGNRVATYVYYQGTSMAAPHVAGVFALMRAIHPALSPDDIDSLLSTESITTDLGETGRDDIFGHGLIDALKAVQAAQQLANGGGLPQQPAFIVAVPGQLTMRTSSDASLTLSNQGDETASITTIVADAGWLNVTADSVDGNGLGDYLVTIDRTGLSDSTYTGSIIFNISTGSSLQVQVTMLVGTVNNDGEVSQIYMLLIDGNSNVVDNTVAVDQGNGEYGYSFSNVSPGAYKIIAGSDIDNDNFICQLSEACGGFPTISALSDIEVTNTDINELEFLIDILSNFGVTGLSSTNNNFFNGIRRPKINPKQLTQ